MTSMEEILQLVADGTLSSEEADELLGRLADEADSPPAESPTGGTQRARVLRIEVSEKGRSVVNLSVPLNVAGLARAFVPGLSDEDSERIQEAIRSGLRGRIVDIASEDGDRVLIVSD
jgi:hypothetical protein